MVRMPSITKLVKPSLQYIKHARVVFDPLDKYAVGAKEWLRTANSPKLRTTNPAATIAMDPRVDKQPSYIAVTYVNDSHKYFLAHKRTVDSIFYDMGMYAGMLEFRHKLDEGEIDAEEVDEIDEMTK